ncbi:hypothetical protein SAMN05661008_00094 [Alkalithermobacter thermoalcaliphilus JW-YL-7 = DSM 7308]|uniref:Uncharacterized protein n=1 Tax=Alkalithermobacter thermoalcaliphilus JW-YL-7 = DSM 7308 TaxID=1121328 RepID=A0A150FRY6_CLOPD|nr:hypothetical protein JWYL7_1427 [[Clostridium] paradoxum JW-YL-7 = DSM 7308]SHK36702.1 hypothetical protein SAMN05661008_00094 [[Clostridium] paradoxum JW-YL-7 = DSM 7308]
MKFTYLKTEMSQHEMLLNQMGAHVEAIRGIMVYVKFDVKQTSIEYVYHINNTDNYFLQRISPYPMILGTFSTKDELIQVIKFDVDQFRNAAKSSMFEKFIEIHKGFNESLKHFEDLYLYYNVPHEIFDDLKDEISKIENLVKEFKEKSKRVYFKKDPDSI